MAGYRYAADPQGGWLYLLPMGLFSQLAPAVAMRVFIVANPIIAGLGLFSFLRLERLSRAGGHRGRALDRDADVDLGDRDLDAVRGRHGVVVRGAGGRRGLPTGNALVGALRLDRARRFRPGRKSRPPT